MMGAHHTFTEPHDAFDPWQAELTAACDDYHNDPLMTLAQYREIADAINIKWRAIEQGLGK